MTPFKSDLIKPGLLFLFCFILLNLQAQLTTNLNPKGERNILEDRSTWVEVESEREVFSSTYLTPDNRIIYHYSKRPLNYYDSRGELVPVSFEPVMTVKGLSAAHQPNEVTLLNDGSVEINTGNGSSIIYSENATINGAPVSAQGLKHNGVNSTMQTGIHGVSKTFEFRFNGLKYNYVLDAPLTSTSTDFIIEEELSIPENSKIIPDNNYGHYGDKGWLGPLLIVADNGEELGAIQGAICYDANKSYVTASYKYERVNGKQKLKMILPNSWINDPSRVFPITIDPLVTGPTTTFGGPIIPSCISPASGSDSILVTIPAGISVTAMLVSGSFYANPFSTAIMNDGAMYFRTECNTSSSYTTTAPAGLSPGTAYLTQGDLKSPLLCCRPQQCTTQTIYVSMHVTRTTGGSGCNSTYIYHNPNSAYPFEAFVEGRTIEGFGPLWNLTPTSICSDECSISGTVFIRYGVPPFTITHPWMTGSVTAGTPQGCSTATTPRNLTLTVPNCPWSCDTISVLSVPPPLVIDACGDTLTGTPSKEITIKEVPDVTASPNPITICSGETFSTTLTSCIPSSTINWSGNSNSGTGTTISETLTNTGTSVSTTSYQVSAVNQGCQSAAITVNVNTVPLPIAGFDANPQPVIMNTPISFSDNSSVFGNNANSWYWTFGDGSSDLTQNPTHTYATAGTYTVCLAMQTSEGCMDTICQDIVVAPAELVLPNIVTPNGDDMNDALYFKYLEFFGTNHLIVYNRWGTVVYEKDNYDNDWMPSDVSDGTYYYVLTVENGDTYSSYLQVMKE